MNINLTEIPPLPVILTIAGIVFLFLGVVRKFGGRVSMDPSKQTPSIIIGAILLIAGVILYVTRPAPEATAKPTEAPTASAGQANLPAATEIPAMQTPAATTLPSAGPAANIASLGQVGPKNFQDGCIDKSIWIPALGNTAPENNGCLDLDRKGMAAVPEKGLAIDLSAPAASSSYGIVTKIPAVATLSFDLQIGKLDTVSAWNTNVGIALLPVASSVPSLDGTSILFQVGKPNTPIWMMLQLPNQSKQIYLPPPRIELNRSYNVRLEVRGHSLATYLDDEKIDERSLGTTLPYLWLGYTVPQGGLLSATISDFSITQQ